MELARKIEGGEIANVWSTRMTTYLHGGDHRSLFDA